MNKHLKRLLHLVLAVGFIALGFLGFGALRAGKPQIEKIESAPPLPVVFTQQVEGLDLPIRIKGEGTVKPLQESNLVPQVGGKVIYVSPSLVNGGEFNRGDLLLRIDPVDYRLAVTLAKAKIKDAESRLELAKEEAAAAKDEWRLLNSDNVGKGGEPPPLVLKKPQLAAAQAKLEADRANLRKAALNLERTELKAPFQGRVGQESVDIGQYATPGQPLAAIYSTDAAEIVVPLEVEDLFWFHVPGFTPGNGKGAAVFVTARLAGRERTWNGVVVRTEGKLDERTRMINVVIRVSKPYAQRPPLIFGLFVTVFIEGRTLQGAFSIPRSALRQGGVVWVVDGDGRLRFQKVEVARIQGEKVAIASGLKDGERVVTSSLKAVSDRMLVRPISLKERKSS